MMGEWVPTDQCMSDIVKRVAPEQDPAYTALDIVYWIKFFGEVFVIALTDVTFLLSVMRTQVDVEQNLQDGDAERDSPPDTLNQNRGDYSERLANALDTLLITFVERIR